MTESDLSTFDDFKDRWAESQPQDFPALKNPRGKKPVADSSNLIEPELLQEDYFIPLIRPIKTFRPYKAPADLGKAYLGLDWTNLIGGNIRVYLIGPCINSAWEINHFFIAFIP